MNPTIYVSSKRIHTQLWQHYRNRGHNIISSWIDIDAIVDSETVGQEYWPRWLEEANKADFLIFYAIPPEKRHDECLLEIGACLLGGGTVIHVGVSETMKSQDGQMADFVHHPRWIRKANLDIAFELIASEENWSDYDWSQHWKNK